MGRSFAFSFTCELQLTGNKQLWAQRAQHPAAGSQVAQEAGWPMTAPSSGEFRLVHKSRKS